MIGLTVLDLQCDTAGLSGLANIVAMILVGLSLRLVFCPPPPKHRLWRRSWG